MTLLVDTSVWSLALRRNVEVATKEVVALRAAIEGSDAVVTTGLVLGVQIGTIDALLIQLCGRYDLTLLSADKDFFNAARFVPFKLWASK